MILKEIYNQEFFELFSASIIKFDANFNHENFLSLPQSQQWQGQELMRRMNSISKSLHQNLGGAYLNNKSAADKYRHNIEILKKVAKDVELPRYLNPRLALIVFANYVENFGLQYFDISIAALEFFTEIGSAEFAIRHFLIHHQEKTLPKLQQFSQSKNYHVRRLASEGCRPRLPWGLALTSFKKNPSLIIPILENLKNDSEEYVRRSVANNLNDICKDNSEVAFLLAQKWRSEGVQDKILSHGLRTLLKKGDQKALKLFGFHGEKNYQISKFILQNSSIKTGENLEFSFSMNVEKPSKIRLEYIIYFLRKDNKFSKKIFQITQKDFDKGNFILRKKHSFRIITTKKYYSGTQQISLVINGEEVEKKEFILGN